MEADELSRKLSGQLFLAAMLNLTDGAYCATYGQGAGMVQLGTMIVAPVNEEYAHWRNLWPKAFLPDDAGAIRRLLAAEIAAVKGSLGDVVTCLSLAGFDVADVAMAAEAFRDVGGDFVELNVHGGLQPWAAQGYLMGMALPQYRQRLIAWAEQLSALPIPLVIKFNTHLNVDFAQICRDLAHLPVFGYHFNVRDEEAKRPKYAFVEAIRPLVKGVLLCSGYAWTTEAARRLFDLGADSVGVAEPAMKDPKFIAKLAQELKELP